MLPEAWTIRKKEAEATLTDVVCGPEHVGGRLKCRLFSTNRDFVEKDGILFIYGVRTDVLGRNSASVT